MTQVIKRGVHWDWSDVPDWKHIEVSGSTLAMVMTGFTPSGCITITWENHIAIADYIFENIPLRDKNDKPVSRDGHIRVLRQCIGFQRFYVG